MIEVRVCVLHQLFLHGKMGLISTTPSQRLINFASSVILTRYTSVTFDQSKELGETEASIDQYRLAIGLKDDLASAWLNLGISLSQLGRIDEAMDAYQVNLQIQGNSLRPPGRVDKGMRDTSSSTLVAFPYSLLLFPVHCAHGVVGNGS